MDRYTHTCRGKLATALEALPDLRHGPAVETSKATRTYAGAEIIMRLTWRNKVHGEGCGWQRMELESDSNTGRDEREFPETAADRSMPAPVAAMDSERGGRSLQPPG